MRDAPIPTGSVQPWAPSGAGSDRAIERSYAFCQRVARRYARNFYYGLMLTPRSKRAALYAIYGFMRACDDLADESAPTDGDLTSPRLKRIAAFRRRMDAVVDERRLGQPCSDGDSVWPAFLHVVQNYPINKHHLHAMLDGQCADLRGQRYENFDQTRDYCYKVASTVGLVCLSVWGYRGDEQTLKLAEQRGIALQLTNILRDLVEDARRGRVYLPADEMTRFGCDEEQLRQGRANDAFDRLMAFQIDRARSYYDRSAQLESFVEPACRPTCWAIMRIYRALLDKIAADPSRVLAGRVRLSAATKLWFAARAAMRRFDS